MVQSALRLLNTVFEDNRLTLSHGTSRQLCTNIILKICKHSVKVTKKDVLTFRGKYGVICR